MRNMSDRGALTVTAAVVVLLFIGAGPIGAAPAAGGRSGEVYLREQIISLLQSGKEIDAIAPAHALYPLRRVELPVTMTYLLLEHDPSALERFYPELRNRVLDLFGEERITTGGLITGPFHEGGSAGIHLSPALNALAAVEVHSLAHTAMRIGAYEDAIELIFWSRRFADRISNGFYSVSYEAFLPVHRNGHYIVRYEPEQLLPLLIDRETGETLRQRIIERTIEARAAVRGRAEGYGGTMNDATTRVVIRELLSTLPYLSEDKLALLGLTAPAAPYAGTAPEHGHWMQFWTHSPTRDKELFSRIAAISCLRSVAAIFERESLMRADDRERFAGDTAALVSALQSSTSDLTSHKANIAVVNRLLAAISNLEHNLVESNQVWKVVDEYRWSSLSPRTKKLVIESFDAINDELLRTKVLLSETFTASTGIIADVDLPQGPVALGTDIRMAATITSGIDSIVLSNVYLQFGSNRWSLTKTGEHVSVSPWTPPLTYIRPLPPVSTGEPGLVSIPYFFDFLHDGRRVEVHNTANVGFVKGRRAALRMPAGRILSDSPLPVELVLRYTPKRNIRGVANGTFLKNVQCDPPLPSRFLIKEGTALTTLPLQISGTAELPPGIYPFALSIELNGETIARFEERLIRPFNWLYLAPLPPSAISGEHVQHYQDNLFASHTAFDGGSIRWRELPSEAVDENGLISPAALIAAESSGAGHGGSGPRGARPKDARSNAAVLLYTIVDAPAPLKTTYHLACETNASVRINGDLVFLSDEGSDANTSGAVLLRKGTNSILVAAAAGSDRSRISFHLSDPSGLPVPGIGNDIASLIDGYYRLARQGTGADPDRGVEAEVTEVTFSLDYPNATDICVIGSFNSWEVGEHQMVRSDDGTWTVSIVLPPGRYPYKFLVDRSEKIIDPKATVIEADGFGGFNSILVLE